MMVLRFRELVVDLERYQVLLDSRPLILSYGEYALLVYLACRAGHVVSRRQLLEEGMGRHDVGGLRMVDERIRHLKSLVEQDGRTYIEAVEPDGYRFVAPGGLAPPGA